MTNPFNALELHPSTEAVLQRARGAWYHEVNVGKGEMADSFHIATLATRSTLCESATERIRAVVTIKPKLRPQAAMYNM